LPSKRTKELHIHVNLLTGGRHTSGRVAGFIPGEPQKPEAGLSTPKLLPPGTVRDELVRKARRAETGSHLTEWLTSPGLRPPE
jgi:hypothetical protein